MRIEQTFKKRAHQWKRLMLKGIDLTFLQNGEQTTDLRELEYLSLDSESGKESSNFILNINAPKLQKMALHLHCQRVSSLSQLPNLKRTVIVTKTLTSRIVLLWDKLISIIASGQ